MDWDFSGLPAGVKIIGKTFIWHFRFERDGYSARKRPGQKAKGRKKKKEKEKELRAGRFEISRLAVGEDIVSTFGLLLPKNAFF